MACFTAVFVCVCVCSLHAAGRGRRCVLAKPSAPGLHIGACIFFVFGKHAVIASGSSVSVVPSGVFVQALTCIRHHFWMWRSWFGLGHCWHGVFATNLWAKGPPASSCVLPCFLAHWFMQAYVIVLSLPPHSIRTRYKCSSFSVRKLSVDVWIVAVVVSFGLQRMALAVLRAHST